MIKLFNNKIIMSKKKLLLISALIFSFLPAFFVQAIEFQNPLKHETFEELVSGIVDFLFYIALAIVPLSVLLGAFYILTAGGEPQRVKTGQNFILYAMIGLAVILFSKGFVSVIKNILGN